MTLETKILEWTLVAILLFPLARAALGPQRLDVLTPPFVFSIFMLLCYVYPLDAFAAGTDEFSTNWDSDPVSRATPQALDGALTVAIIAAVTFFIGYYALKPGSSRPNEAPESPPADTNRLLLVGVVYSVLGIGLFLIGVYFIGGFSVLLGRLGDRLRTFAGLNYFMGGLGLLLCVSLAWFGDLLIQKKRASWKFLAFSAFAIIANGFEGSKSTIFVFVVALAIMYHVMYRPIGITVVISGAAVLFVILTAYALFAREYLAVGEFTTVDPQHLGESDVLGALQRELDGNFIQLQMLTTLIDRMPAQLPFQHGRTYLSLLTMPIPRGFWPDKPLPSTGVIALAFWPSRWLDWGTTMPPGLVGEMYLNFGRAGVACGMFLFGSLYAMLDRWLLLQPRNVIVVTLYALVLGLMPHYLRGEAVAPTVLLLMWGVPCILAEKYVFRASPVSPRTRSMVRTPVVLREEK